MPYVSVLNFRMGNNESVVGINHIHVLYVMTPLIMPVSTDAQCGQRHANDARTHVVPIGRHEDCDTECVCNLDSSCTVARRTLSAGSCPRPCYISTVADMPICMAWMADHTVGHLGGSDLLAGENRYSSSRSRSWFAWLSVNVASYTFQFSGGNAGGICVAAGWTVARHWMTSVAAGCAEPCC